MKSGSLVQRLGSALHLSIHFPMLFLDGVYRASGRLAASPLRDGAAQR
jgi:hypothetical protein